MPGGVAALQGSVPSWGHSAEPETLTWANFTGCLHPHNAAEEGEKNLEFLSLAVLSFFMPNKSVTVPFRGSMCSAT